MAIAGEDWDKAVELKWIMKPICTRRWSAPASARANDCDAEYLYTQFVLPVMS